MRRWLKGQDAEVRGLVISSGIGLAVVGLGELLIYLLWGHF